MRRILVAALAVPLVVVPVSTAEAAGPSTTVVCGQTLTASTRLANDLLNCQGNGLVIAASGVTIDLAGHAIDGVNTPGSQGVVVDGHANVRIENGTITDFFVNGVGLHDAPHATVTKLRIRRIGAGGLPGDSSAGVLVQSSPGSVVMGSTVTNSVAAYQADGVDVISSPGTLVADNDLSRNAWDGMFVLNSPRSRVLNNRLAQNMNHGLEVNYGSNSIKVLGNQAWGNAVNGIVVGALAHGVISNNVLTGNGYAGLFCFDLVDSRVSGNAATGNAFGILLTGGQSGSMGNTVTLNRTNRNGLGGLLLVSAANDNSVVGNTANENQGVPGQGGGIVVLGSAGNLLDGNVANRNVGAGITVFEQAPGDSAGNVLKANLANKNTAHGIAAIDGTVDAGGNTAHGNTPAPNCLGVVCS